VAATAAAVPSRERREIRFGLSDMFAPGIC